ncbi:MAG TPA: hypothetical protein VIY08_12655 [Candidatus Nitrosocosmicus sp.]
MKAHPVLSYYNLNQQGHYKCNRCSVQYAHPLLDTLKKHYARSHKTIWDQIKDRNCKVKGRGIIKQIKTMVSKNVSEDIMQGHLQQEVI